MDGWEGPLLFGILDIVSLGKNWRFESLEVADEYVEEEDVCGSDNDGDKIVTSNMFLTKSQQMNI